MTAADPGTQAAPRSRSGLFLRIYLTFAATVLVFAVLAAAAMWVLHQRYGPEYVDERIRL